MTFIVANEQNAYERLIADGLADVLAEMRSIDLLDLVSFIRFDRYAALDDLLQSSTELFFKEGTFTFAWNAGVTMPWEDMPSVTLGMEFNHGTVSVFFNLTLKAMAQAVEVVGVMFDPDCHDPAERRRRLGQAIADARLSRVPTGSWPQLPPGPGRSDAAGKR